MFTRLRHSFVIQRQSGSDHSCFVIPPDSALDVRRLPRRSLRRRVRRSTFASSRMPRCPWATTEPNITYHDKEWGVPIHHDRKLFEFLILEGAQAGLSWTTILKKRENYRKAFDGFRAEKIARYGARDVKRLLGDTGIVRNRLKIAATIQNAKAFLAVRKEFGSFDAYLWSFVGGKPKQNRWRRLSQVPARTTGIRRHESRFGEARIQVRRLDHLLRLDASDRHGQRSSRVMSAARGTRRPASAQVKL